jgi:hypothetical protein
MSGWIRLHRQLKENWIWHDPVKLKWWLDILLSTNHADNKVLLKGVLVECKRGQCVKSLETWAKDWRTTKKTVSTFFKMLQKEKMLTVESVKISTRITVCKYDSYNNSVNADDPAEETQTTPHSKRTLPPNNKGNNDNNDKERKELLFSLFWDKYGKKRDAAKCRDKFLKIPLSEVEKILPATEAYVLANPDKKFRKDPIRWLTGSHWKDEDLKPRAEPICTLEPKHFYSYSEYLTYCTQNNLQPVQEN